MAQIRMVMLALNFKSALDFCDEVNNYLYTRHFIELSFIVKKIEKYLFFFPKF